MYQHGMHLFGHQLIYINMQIAQGGQGGREIIPTKNSCLSRRRKSTTIHLSPHQYSDNPLKTWGNQTRKGTNVQQRLVDVAVDEGDSLSLELEGVGGKKLYVPVLAEGAPGKAWTTKRYSDE